MSKLKVNEVTNLAQDGSLNFMGNYDVILPANIGTISGTVTLPSGRVWSDYEKIELLTANGSTSVIGNSAIATKELMQLTPDSWTVVAQYASGASVGITATSSNTASIARSGGAAGIKQIIDYRKNGVA